MKNKNEIIEDWEAIQVARVIMEEAHDIKLKYINEQNFELAAHYRDLERENGIFLLDSDKLTKFEQRIYHIKYHGPD